MSSTLPLMQDLLASLIEAQDALANFKANFMLSLESIPDYSDSTTYLSFDSIDDAAESISSSMKLLLPVIKQSLKSPQVVPSEDSPLNVLVLDGSIGAGKSELIEFVKSDPELSQKVRAIEEPLAYFEDLLPDYYKNPQQLGTMIQSIIMGSHNVSSQKYIKEEMAKPPHERKLLLFERCPRSCNLFTECMNLQDYEKRAIYRLSELLTHPYVYIIPRVDRRVYLRADPQVCQDRIKKRNRKGEEDIPLAYLEKLHAEHERFIETFKEDQKVVIDSNDKDLTKVHQEFKTFILEYLTNK